MLDFDSALQDVSKAFRTPRAILEADLSAKQKDRLLQQWEYDLRSQQVAADESMTSNRPGATGELLKQVKDCRTELGLDRGSDKQASAPTKQGGS
jgi:hypothetical protein